MIKSNYADTLNALSEMQETPLYQSRRGVLAEAERLILALEQQLEEAKRDTARLDKVEAELRQGKILNYYKKHYSLRNICFQEFMAYPRLREAIDKGEGDEG